MAYLHAWETGLEGKVGIRKWAEFCNLKRPHFALSGRPLAVVNRLRNETNAPDQQV